MTAGDNSDSIPENAQIAVLGGLGFMGSHICRELVRGGHSVRIFDKLYASRELVKDIERHVEIFEGDISHSDTVLNAIGDSEIVIDLIHTTVPGSSMDDPAYDVMTNVVASIRWLERLPETKVHKILYVSSGGTVYGVPQTIPIDENHPTNPISSYGITKLTIEKYITMYCSMFNVNYYILRPSNVYGAGQRLNIGQGVVGVLIDRALRGEKLEIWGTGSALRDYLHIKDLVAAAMSLLLYMGPHRIFNASSGNGHSVLDIIAVLRDLIESLPQVVHIPARGFDVPSNVLSSLRLERETGWDPKINLKTGIADTVEWLKIVHKHGAAETSINERLDKEVQLGSHR